LGFIFAGKEWSVLEGLRKSKKRFSLGSSDKQNSSSYWTLSPKLSLAEIYIFYLFIMQVKPALRAAGAQDHENIHIYVYTYNNKNYLLTTTVNLLIIYILTGAVLEGFLRFPEFSLDNGYTPFQLQGFTRYTQRAE